MIAADVGETGLAGLPEWRVEGLAPGEHHVGTPYGSRDPHEIGIIAGNDDFGDPAMSNLECGEGVRERRRSPLDESSEQNQDAVGVVGVALIARERSESDEREGCGRVGRRHRLVMHILLPNHELLGIVGGGEQTSVVSVPEVIEHRVGGLDGEAGPVGPSGRFTQPGERVDERGVVGGERGVAGPRLSIRLPGTEPASIQPHPVPGDRPRRIHRTHW